MGVEERRQKLREALVSAAERAITERGLPGINARELAKEAGCAVGAIYTVFPDLDALVLEVNLRTLALFDREIGEEQTQSRPGDAGLAIGELVRLGDAYLSFASRHPKRWRALFQHRMANERAPPDWYVEEQTRLFRRVEAPLRILRPELSDQQAALLARTLFSATHGIVSLGLDEKLMALPPDLVREQLETLVRAVAVGLSGRGRRGTP